MVEDHGDGAGELAAPHLLAAGEQVDETPPIDLSVLIVNWNTRELLRECLLSVAGESSRIRIETIVVDNGSTDGSIEMVRREFPWVTLIANHENLGFAAANNQAIQRSQGRHVLLLNSDATLGSGSAKRLVDLLDDHRKAAVVGGKLLNPDGSFQGSFYDFPTLKSDLLILTYLARLIYPPAYPSYPPEQSEERRAVDWVNGAFLAARRKAIEEVGLLDESSFMYSEEVDWCYRFRMAGWEILYEPTAIAYHRIGGSAERVAGRVPERRRAMIFHGKWWFLRKHRGAVPAAIFLWSARVWSALMMSLWALHAVGGPASTREYAHAQAASFRYVLTHL